MIYEFDGYRPKMICFGAKVEADNYEQALKIFKQIYLQYSGGKPATRIKQVKS